MPLLRRSICRAGCWDSAFHRRSGGPDEVTADSSPAPATSPSRSPRGASQEKSIKLGCGCGPIARRRMSELVGRCNWQSKNARRSSRSGAFPLSSVDQVQHHWPLTTRGGHRPQSVFADYVRALQSFREVIAVSSGVWSGAESGAPWEPVSVAPTIIGLARANLPRPASSWNRPACPRRRRGIAHRLG